MQPRKCHLNLLTVPRNIEGQIKQDTPKHTHPSSGLQKSELPIPSPPLLILKTPREGKAGVLGPCLWKVLLCTSVSFSVLYSKVTYIVSSFAHPLLLLCPFGIHLFLSSSSLPFFSFPSPRPTSLILFQLHTHTHTEEAQPRDTNGHV